MTDIVEKVRNLLIAAIEQDKITLPTLPEVALKVREVAEDPDVSAADLAKVIQNDTALTARVIKVANSPLLRGANKIENVQMAVSRLGISYTANLATGLAMEQMFQATSDTVDRIMREVWKQSTEVAGMAYVLAKHYTRLKPDEAMLAGLVHQLGVLPILTFAEDHPNLLNNSVVLEKVMAGVHADIGTLILQKWDFPEGIRNVPRDYQNFEREIPEADYSDLVTVATLQSYADTNHRLAKMDWAKVPAFKRLGISTEMTEEHSIAEDVTADMDAAMAMLNADRKD